MAYLPLLIFLLLAIVVIATEAIWLVAEPGRRAAERGHSRSQPTLSDSGSAVCELCDLWRDADDDLWNIRTGGKSSEASYWGLAILALLFPIAALSLVKRLFMLIFTMPGGKQARIFSLVAGSAAAAIVAIPPGVILYLLFQYSY